MQFARTPCVGVDPLKKLGNGNKVLTALDTEIGTLGGDVERKIYISVCVPQIMTPATLISNSKPDIFSII